MELLKFVSDDPYLEFIEAMDRNSRAQQAIVRLADGSIHIAKIRQASNGPMVVIGHFFAWDLEPMTGYLPIYIEPDNG